VTRDEEIRQTITELHQARHNAAEVIHAAVSEINAAHARLAEALGARLAPPHPPARRSIGDKHEQHE
jgi:hypothetical protein